MRTTLLFFITFFYFVNTQAQCVGTVYIPDDNFKTALLAIGSLNPNYDNTITCQEASNFSGSIDVSNKSIETLTGIEAFVNITSLSIVGNDLLFVDLSENTKLEKVFCSDNTLISLDVSNSPLLNELRCSGNSIDELDLSQNLNLRVLECSNNVLTNLNVSNNTALTQLFCTNNELSSLYLGNNLDLVLLDCSDNQIENIDVSHIETVRSVVCTNNALNSLNISNGKNDFFYSIDAVNNPDLSCIQVDDVAYSTTNWSANIDDTASFNTDCTTPVCYVNIPDVGFKSILINNRDINTNQDYEISCEEAADFTGELDVNQRNIFDVTGIEAFVNLTALYCADNELISLDVSENTALQQLFCNGNSLTNLDVNRNTALVNLFCNENAISSIDVSSNINLKILNVFENQLTDLSVANNFVLQTLYCEDNLLTSLDITTNNDLTILKCSNNSLASLNIANGNNYNFTELTTVNNPNLSCIQVDDEAYSDDVWFSYKDAIVSYSEDCANYSACYINIPDSNFKAYLIGEGDINTNNDTEISCEEAAAYTGSLFLNNKSITNLTGLEAFTNITRLYCYFMGLTSLDISTNVELISIDCRNNELTNLDVSKNLNLRLLDCAENDLTSINVSENTSLESLSLSYNNLTSLEVSSNLQLSSIYCPNNQLTSLDLSNNTELGAIDVSNNALTSLNIQNGNNQYNSDNYYFIGNPNLTCIQVDNKELADNALYWSKDDNTQYNEDCSGNTTCYVNIPDVNFKAALVANTTINTDGDTEISCDEAIATSSLFLYDRAITDLTGIEAFVNITSLTCSNNSLSSLDVSKNTALTDLLCSENMLTSLDISKNTALTRLWSSNNLLESLDVTKNIVLTELWCYNNSLTSLDISNNTVLEELNCSGNSISNLNVFNNSVLDRLDCDGNSLSTLDVSNNALLTSLSCGSNQITKLDVSGNSLLRSLYCSNNSLWSLNIKNTPDLDGFSASSNASLTCIEVSNVAQSNSQWSDAIDDIASFSTDCSGVVCYVNIPDTNFKALLVADTNININGDTEISCDEANNYTGGINVGSKLISDLTGIESFVNINELICFSNNLVSLDVSSNTLLEYLDCGSNELQVLDVSKNTLLTTLDCSRNSLISLDTSGCTVLTSLETDRNGLSNLALSSNINLDYLICNNNNLESLDVSKNVLLSSLAFSNNEITSIDVSKNTLLKSLYFRNNAVKDLDVSKNTLLETLSCHTNLLTNLDLTTNTLLRTLSCHTNSLTSLNLATDSTTGISTLLNTLDATSNSDLTCIQVDALYLDDYTSNPDFQKDDTASYSTDCNYDTTCYVTIPNVNFKALLVADTTINTNGDAEISCDEAFGYTGKIDADDSAIDNFTGIEAFTNITELWCSENSLTNIDISKNVALKVFYSRSNSLTSLDVSKNKALTVLSISGNLLTSLDVSENTSLRILNCENNKLTSLDVSNNNLLESLECSKNSLTNLNVYNAKVLGYISCSSNNLETLNLSTNESLYALYCYINKLTSLDLSNNPELYYFNCTYNSLRSLNVANGNNTKIDPTVQYPGIFDTRNNFFLTCIQVDNASYSSENWINIDSRASFSINCGATASTEDTVLEEFSLYPNPVEEVLKLTLSEELQKVTIHTLQGKKVIETNTKEITVVDFSSGIYVLKIHTSSGKIGVRRFVKR